MEPPGYPGRIKPVEFGYKAQVVDNVDGIIVDHEVVIGNPANAPMLAPAISRIKARFAKTPTKVTADRGHGEASVDDALVEIGVTTVAIPRKGKPTAARIKVQRQRGFVKLVKWRTGSEARISCLKRDFGWRRTLFDGHDGVQTWCGWGVLAHNSTKIAKLTTAKTATTRQRRAPRPPGSDPPTAAPPERTAA